MSENWLSKIERVSGRFAGSTDSLNIARELRVSLGDLLGQPVLMEDDKDRDNVPRLRDSLMAPRQLYSTRPLRRSRTSTPPARPSWSSSGSWTTSGVCLGAWSTPCPA